MVNTYVFDSNAVTQTWRGAVIGQAFRGRTYFLNDDQGGEKEAFVGGLPDFVYCDNGTNFLATELNEKFAGLCVRVIPTQQLRSNEKRGPRTAPRDPRNPAPRPAAAVDRRGKEPQASWWTAAPHRPEAVTGSAVCLGVPVEPRRGAARRVVGVDRRGRSHPTRHRSRTGAARTRAPRDVPALHHRRPPGQRALHLPELTRTPSKRFTVRRWRSAMTTTSRSSARTGRPGLAPPYATEPTPPQSPKR